MYGYYKKITCKIQYIKDTCFAPKISVQGTLEKQAVESKIFANIPNT